MWGTMKHELVSAGTTFGSISELSGGRTAVTVTFWYQCQCGRVYGTQSTLEFASADALDSLVSGWMSAGRAVASQLATTEHCVLSSSALSTTLTRILRDLSE